MHEAFLRMASKDSFLINFSRCHPLLLILATYFYLKTNINFFLFKAVL